VTSKAWSTLNVSLNWTAKCNLCNVINSNFVMWAIYSIPNPFQSVTDTAQWVRDTTTEKDSLDSRLQSRDLQGTSWEPKSNMQNHFRTNEKKSILTRKNTFYSTLFARRLYNYSELFPSPVFQSVLDIKINATPSWKRLFTWFFKESLKWGKT